MHRTEKETKLKLKKETITTAGKEKQRNEK
jgi:hypothetical protein